MAPAPKSAPNPVRHDFEPLTKRFPALGQPVKASWVSGIMGTPLLPPPFGWASSSVMAPGPSIYWLDCVVEIDPETAAELKRRYRPAPTDNRPDVWKTLTTALPAGGYLNIDSAFTSPETDICAKAFLAQDVPVVVITALGE